MSFSSKIEYAHFNEVNEAMISYGTEKPLAYRPRLVDERLQRLLTTFGAVEIRGTKWCGKSWAALAFGESVIHLDDPNVTSPTRPFQPPRLGWVPKESFPMGKPLACSSSRCAFTTCAPTLLACLRLTRGLCATMATPMAWKSTPSSNFATAAGQRWR